MCLHFINMQLTCHVRNLKWLTVFLKLLQEEEVFWGYMKIIVLVLDYLIDSVLLFLFLFLSKLVSFFQNIDLYFS